MNDEDCRKDFMVEHQFDPSAQRYHLTDVQLMEMTGQKVWVQTPGIPEYGRYGIVEGYDPESKSLFLKNDFTCHDYGKVWVAYLPSMGGDDNAVHGE